jgi:hypothetical protein
VKEADHFVEEPDGAIGLAIVDGDFFGTVGIGVAWGNDV